MKLYYHPLSNTSRKTRIVWRQLDLEVEEVFVDFATGAHKAPPHLALNPNGRVPVLVDEDRVLFESNAICCRFAEGTELWPDGVRFEVLQWLFWETNHLTRAIGQVAVEVVLVPMRGGTPDAEIIKTMTAEFREHARVLDAALAGREWLVGEEMTIADLAVATSMPLAQVSGVPLTPWPNIDRWFEQVQALASWQATPYPNLD